MTTLHGESILAPLLRCPRCSSALRFDPALHCACGYQGRSFEGIADFVDDAGVTDQQREEISAQTTAVDAYYENELKLTCHWDRLSAEELPGLLGYPAGLALDLGCGTGTAGGGLKNSGMTVIGADLSPACLVQARRRLDAVVRTTASHLPFADGIFDAVVCRGALHHVDDPRTALKEMARVMRPGARALFMDPREYAWLEPVKRVLRKDDHSFSEGHRAFEPEEYAELIGGVFRLEKNTSFYPLTILAAHGLDILPLPKFLPRRPLAQALLTADQKLTQTPLGKFGHLLVVVAQKAA